MIKYTVTESTKLPEFAMALTGYTHVFEDCDSLNTRATCLADMLNEKRLDDGDNVFYYCPTVYIRSGYQWFNPCTEKVCEFDFDVPVGNIIKFTVDNDNWDIIPEKMDSVDIMKMVQEWMEKEVFPNRK